MGGGVLSHFAYMEEMLHFEQGATLVHQGAVEHHAFVIESGSVKIAMQDGDQEQILGIAGIGDVVGEMALFEDAPRSANVIAIEATMARRMTREHLGDAMQSDPEACMPFLRAILDRLRTSNAMLFASQQTKDLIKTTRVRLSFEPLTNEAVLVCPKKAVIELDIVPNEGTTQIVIQGLQKHFKVNVESFLPHMQR